MMFLFEGDNEEISGNVSFLILLIMRWILFGKRSCDLLIDFYKLCKLLGL